MQTGLVRHQGVLEHGLHIFKKSGLLVPDFAFDKKTTGRAGLFAVPIGKGTGVDDAESQLANLLAGEAGGRLSSSSLRIFWVGVGGMAVLLSDVAKWRITWGSHVKKYFGMDTHACLSPLRETSQGVYWSHTGGIFMLLRAGGPA